MVLSVAFVVTFAYHTHLHHKVDYHSIKRNDEGPRRYGILHAPYMHAIQCHDSAQLKLKIRLTIELYVIIQYKTEYNKREDAQRCQVHAFNFWSNYHDRNS